jgi:NAD(P)-dependent dehydrogenase (short-subunit alcohol dehydrogenase family)
MSDLSGKSVIVTGAGGGIGSATASLLAERGAKVLVADINLAGAERVAKEIGATAFHLDLAEESSIVAMVKAALDKFGRIDALCNIAADQSPELYPRDRDIETMEAEVWDRTFRVNARGTMLACKHVLGPMKRAGKGAIVNMASNLGLQGSLIQSAYAASKAAIIQLTRSIATSHGKDGIRCNTVSPGLTLTPSVKSTIPDEIRAIVEADSLTPYLGEPRDIAVVVAFLISDEARYITGQNFIADGGTASHMPSVAPMRALFAKG